MVQWLLFEVCNSKSLSSFPKEPRDGSFELSFIQTSKFKAIPCAFVDDSKSSFFVLSSLLYCASESL
jgi:hypothetical protein